MIAVRANRQKGQPSDFKRLVEYMLDAAKTDGEIRIANCLGAETPEEVVAVVQATQKLNVRAKGDPTYHLVVSFPPGERPAPERLRAIEEELCAAIGFAGHQRISCGHVDRDHYHFHVAINKVHPESLRFIEPYYDEKTLNRACERLEIEHGLTRTNHGAKPRQGLPARAGDIEARSGEASFLGWVRETAAADALAALDAGQGWGGLHSALAAHGLEIKPRGAGLVIVQQGKNQQCGGLAVKASSVDRRLALTALTERFGDFEPSAFPVAEASSDRSDANQKPRYQRGPKQPGAGARRLYAQFQQERAAALEARRTARSRKGVRRRPRPPLSWPGFLQEKASGGDADALAALRWRKSRQTRAAKALLTAASPEQARHMVFSRLKPRTMRNGAVLYRVQDGGVVVDEARQVWVEELSAHAAFLALSLAAERFAGQALIVEGSSEFKAQIAAMAAAHKLDARFADPALEAERQRQTASPATPEDKALQRSGSRSTRRPSSIR